MNFSNTNISTNTKSKSKSKSPVLLVVPLLLLTLLLVAALPTAQGFHSIFPAATATTPSSLPSTTELHSAAPQSSSSTSTSTSSSSSTEEFKKVLFKEYASFFNPMIRDYYSDTVTFDDPMTSLQGVDAYQNNVDMLAGRTLLGKILFDDAGIVLHNITTSSVSSNDVEQLVTRWTLRITVKILPWKPTARFTGISVYDVRNGAGKRGVLVQHQTDYWDSINLKPNSGGQYQKVDTIKAVQDFIDQLKPENAIAPPSASAELPYQLLRRGQDYEVRRYPAYAAVQLPYTRRDEAFGTLGSFCSGMKPLAPAIMAVQQNDSTNDNDVDGTLKFMKWPLCYANPGETAPSQTIIDQAKSKLSNDERYQNLNCQVEIVPSQVMAVGSFSDASMEPVVRKADRQLREALQRDGLQVSDDTKSRVQFAQYDAIFSMGKRRGETWIPLKDGGHPW